MLEGAALGSLPWGDIGLVGVCAVLTLTQLRMVMSGKFVPREQVDMLLTDLRSRNQFLEQASQTKDLTIGELVTQNAKLTAQGELSVRLLESISVNSNARSGSDYVAPTQE
ncbi:hypothetical protein IU448_15290 [Nocardia flavorosea]|uniref:hypothetical protein n=1 Tax=Nocardia flavorosea TaxID=53429 RepID=UPI0018932DF0|nr:hypothetical protein [Nocardia flavorosea]MBF6350370.1 hypothetical protein [Nocardia flavorosea]